MEPTPAPASDSTVLARLTRTRQALGGRLWLAPILLALVIATLGFWTRHRIEGVMQSSVESSLRTLLDTAVAALRLWLDEKQADVRAVAVAPGVRAAIQQLVEHSRRPGVTAVELTQSDAQATLREELRPVLQHPDCTDFIVATPDLRIIASTHDQLVGQSAASYEDFIRKTLEPGARVTRPFPSRILLPNAQGQLQEGVPTMLALAPVHDSQGQLLAFVALRLRPALGFDRLLAIAWLGQTGDTCAFDRSGRLLSPTRFESQLKQLGLLPDRDGVSSVLNVVLRDPGVNLTEGRRPPRPPAEQPLTLAVEEAIAGRPGLNVVGYRDARGVQVVGAWTWLPDYDFGMFTQIDRAEAYQPVQILRTAFGLLFGVLLFAGIALLAFVVIVDHLRKSMRHLLQEVRQLGQYTLGEKLGAGATGTVYRARQALLRRPVAIKLLDPAKTNPESEARFEREVQITSRLNHPNTITIYDFGRTPEGLFYCAMECLDGLDLRSLVDRHGPLPEGRVIHLLRQACGALAEAHDQGLVHRDIKPANLIVGCRGGLHDFLKVLDFGMVRAIRGDLHASLTLPDCVVGTPLYLSPEAVDAPAEVEPRSDLYSLGAVGYFLLTGKPLFESTQLAEVLRLQVNTLPERPSRRLGAAVSPDLEDLLMRCLAKNMYQRPNNARELEAALAACRSSNSWTQADAARWWATHVETHRPPDSPAGRA